MDEKKLWSKDEIKMLICMYEENSTLWDTKCVDFRNREKKAGILQKIAAAFNCTAEEVQRKLHNLRNQVSQELKKISKKKSGTSTNDIYISSWPYFSALKFIIPSLTPRKTKSSLSTQSSLDSTSYPTNALDIEPKCEEHVWNEVVEIVSDEERDQKKQPNRKDPTNNQKRKRNDEGVGDMLFKTAVGTLQTPPDDYERFGQYVAMELRDLRSDFYKRRLKREIRNAIIRIIEEEETYYASSSSNASPPA